MKADQVTEALKRKFLDEGERLVFWHDARGEFGDFVQTGLGDGLEDIQVLQVAEMGGLSVKLKVERECPEAQFLIYSRGERPPAESDWLLDIRLYSATFEAEMSSLWARELGLHSLAIKDHLTRRSAFLGNKERRAKLQRLVAAGDGPEQLDAKMIAVLVGASLGDARSIVMALCEGHAEGGSFELGVDPKVFGTLAKMDLIGSFWDLMSAEFGFDSAEPRLGGLLRSLFVTDFLSSLNEGAEIPSLEHLSLAPAGKSQNAEVLLDQWRDSTTSCGVYRAVANAIEVEQGITDQLLSLELGQLERAFTFWGVERRAATLVKAMVADGRHEVDLDAVRAIVSRRINGPWLRSGFGGEEDAKALESSYLALQAAAELFVEVERFKHGSSPTSPTELLNGYVARDYRIDQLYREYFALAPDATGKGWDLLKSLSPEVEAAYDTGYVTPLGIRWSEMLDEGFLQSWQMEGFPPQQEFYRRYPGKRLSEGDRKRAFVIISDAFRYEAAVELCRRLNGRDYTKAELKPMLGVLPSYTALGMASLLPHQVLSYSAAGEVLVDGKSTAGTKARDKVLQGVEGMACQASDLLPMKTEDARAFVKDKRVVYIYHNVIDAQGDSASTEESTFEAVATCIAQLEEIAAFCANRLNARKIWITADHGFLFQVAQPKATDKSHLLEKPEGAVKSKKRYVVGRELGNTEAAHWGMVRETGGDTSGMEYWLPRGANRFHFTGGARFVHGGAMPQEVVIPLLTVDTLRSASDREESKSAKVNVQLLGQEPRITTPRYRFEFIQTDKVTPRLQPLTVTVGVYRGSSLVTTLETIVFDSESDRMDDRKREAMLELAAGQYHKSEDFRLILRDSETQAEVLTSPVTIDRSFDDDF